MIRKAAPHDLDQIRLLIEKLTRVYDQEEVQLVFSIRQGNPTYLTYVWDENGVIAGTASMLVEQKFGGVVGHIEDVVVADSHERKGIGKALIKKLCSEAAEFNCYKVVLNCQESNKQFYAKCGFKEDGVFMRLNLENSSSAGAA